MGVMDTMTTGVKALNVHGKRIEISAKNIANLDTPNYVRKIPVLSATDDLSFHGLMNEMKNDVFSTGSIPFIEGGVAFTGVVEDPTLGMKIYRPGHPDADANGYIRSSNVNPLVEMADAQNAQRAYEANLAVLTISRTMALKAADIGKG